MVALATLVGVSVGVALPRSSSGLQPPAAPSYAMSQVFNRNINVPDPAVLVGSGTDYLYAAGDGSGVQYMPIYPFRQLGQLGQAIDGMPTPPSWSSDWIWPADIRKSGSRYVMWFTAIDRNEILPTGAPAKCIGVAISSSPTGPYLPGPAPVICDAWGSIDPRTFVDPNGQLWLDWKSDDNAAVQAPSATRIWAQRLAPDGDTLMGVPAEIFHADQSWEGNLVEAPDMVLLDSHYYLFFSGNASSSPSSGIGVATCAGPAGPCQDPALGPLLGSNVQGAGPGEESIFEQDGATWLLYSPNAIFGTNISRPLAVARVAVGTHGPYISTFDGLVPGFPTS